MGQLDDIPPIRRPKGNPVYGDPFRTLDDGFLIKTPDPDMLPGRGGGDGDGEPQDDDQRDDHPFAISAQVTELGLSGEATKVRVKVLGGKYSTGDGTPIAVAAGDYPTEVINEEQTTTNYVGNALLFVPIEICLSTDTGAVRMSDGRYARAIAGGVVYMSKTIPAAFPVPIRNPITDTPGFFVHLGTWTSRYAEQSTGGTPTRQNRLTISQNVRDDVVLAAGSDTNQSYAHPFQVAITNTSDPAAPKARVSASSRLYTSLSTTGAGITGLNTDITLASNTHVWLQATVSSLATTARSIQTGTAWPSLVVLSGSNQTQFNVPIGRVTASAPTAPGFEFTISGTAYHFEQCLFSHLLVENRCNSGTPIIYAFPFGGAA